jgi:hypothetical protein
MYKCLFCFWTGDNVMPSTRIEALRSMSNSKLNVQLITNNELHFWIKKDYPLHEAYQFLSYVHRADYLRVYFMHHYGGGYSDIKFIYESWHNSWSRLQNSEKIAIGYREIGLKGVAMIPSLYYFILLINWRKLLGNGAYIFKSNTFFTSEWLNLTNILLDKNLKALKINPANHPEDYKGKLINGIRSSYPLKWSSLLGNIFHPLCYKHCDHLLNSLPKPEMHCNYDI